MDMPNIIYREGETINESSLDDTTSKQKRGNRKDPPEESKS